MGHNGPWYEYRLICIFPVDALCIQRTSTGFLSAGCSCYGSQPLQVFLHGKRPVQRAGPEFLYYVRKWS